MLGSLFVALRMTQARERQKNKYDVERFAALGPF